MLKIIIELFVGFLGFLGLIFLGFSLGSLINFFCGEKGKENVIITMAKGLWVISFIVLVISLSLLFGYMLLGGL